MGSRRYAVNICPAAKRDFRALTPDVQRKIKPLIDALADDPRPVGTESFKKIKGGYRLRKGAYRVVYQVKDRELRCWSFALATGKRSTTWLNE